MDMGWGQEKVLMCEIQRGFAAKKAVLMKTVIEQLKHVEIFAIFQHFWVK
jgi:hypothetical protein